MASFHTTGFGNFFADGDMLPLDVQDEMLETAAEIVTSAQVAEGMKQGVYLTGDTLYSIAAGEPMFTKDGARCIIIRAPGLNERGNRNSEVAFLNEYGTTHQAPRPFIRTANNDAADAAVEAAADIYTDHLSKNF